jgi:hypothetical protein
MRFYFDESGDFSPPKDTAEHKAAVVVGVDIPEVIESAVFATYDKYVASLSAAELERGEPKGRRLNDKSRRRFCEMMVEQRDVFVTPALLDLTTLANGRAKAGTESLIRKLNLLAPQCTHETLANEFRLLARQITNLSTEQNLRILATARSLFHALKYCILFHSGKEYDSCWENIEIHIDPVQAQAGSRERIVFEHMMLGWIAAWTQSEPIIAINEIHTKDHPFVRKYSLPTGKIDLGALLRDRIHWTSSATNRGIQIADMCATINAQAIRRVVTPSDLGNYGQLMRRNVLAPDLAPGLFTVGDEVFDLGGRYVGLLGAIKRARQEAK